MWKDRLGRMQSGAFLALNLMVCILMYLPVGSIHHLNYNIDTDYLKLCFLQLLNHLGLDTAPFCLFLTSYQPVLWGFDFYLLQWKNLRSAAFSFLKHFCLTVSMKEKLDNVKNNLFKVWV